MAAVGEVFRLDGHDEDDISGVVELHYEYLSDSPILAFGDAFVREFFYTHLVRAGLIGVTAVRSEGRIVGFISYTREPLGFMTKGVRRHPFRLAWILTRAVVARPATLAEIWSTLRMMRDRSGESGEIPDDRGEVISLVADTAHQRLVPEGGKERLTARLFKETVQWYREQGCGSFHFLVKPENKASNLFCSVLGCRFEKIVRDGLTIHRYVYELPDD